MKKIYISLSLLLAGAANCMACSIVKTDTPDGGGTEIPADPPSREEEEPGPETPDPVLFRFDGVKEVIAADGTYILNRHTDGMWQLSDINNIAANRARTQTGIRITFKTDSKTVTPLFSEREGTLQRKVNNYYGVYRDGVFVKDYPGGSLFLTNPEGKVTEWTLVLPIMYGVDFCGVQIGPSATLFPVEEKPHRPVYLAIGDSITHGAGLQGCSSVLSYPYVLAEENGYDLYNVAVGGSQISPGIAYEFEDIQADYITVMWGYNDWNALKGDLVRIRERYKALIENLLATQKTARIFCILPTVARDETGGENYQSGLQGVRDAEEAVLREIGSGRITVIDGKSLTTLDGLNGQVHFNNEGSRQFGKALANWVR